MKHLEHESCLLILELILQFLCYRCMIPLQAFLFLVFGTHNGNINGRFVYDGGSKTVMKGIGKWTMLWLNERAATGRGGGGGGVVAVGRNERRVKTGRCKDASWM